MIDLSGAIDLHVHTAPDVYPRSVDDFGVVRRAEQEGMRAVLLKSHHTLTADRAAVAAKGAGLAVFGGLALNRTVGGLNPDAVEAALAFGAKQIWMPTIHATHCLKTAEQEMFRAEARKGVEGISILDGEGGLVPEIGPLLELIRDADVILGTGHLSPGESLALLRRGKDMGLKKMLVTHPLMSFIRFPDDGMREAVSLGARLEFDALSCWKTWPGAVPPARTAAAIRAVGPSHCVLATDGGQASNPSPPAMLREFVASLSNEGISEADLRVMMCASPAQLLGL